MKIVENMCLYDWPIFPSRYMKNAVWYSGQEKPPRRPVRATGKETVTTRVSSPALAKREESLGTYYLPKYPGMRRNIQHKRLRRSYDQRRRHLWRQDTKTLRSSAKRGKSKEERGRARKSGGRATREEEEQPWSQRVCMLSYGAKLVHSSIGGGRGRGYCPKMHPSHASPPSLPHHHRLYYRLLPALSKPRSNRRRKRKRPWAANQRRPAVVYIEIP